MQEMVVYGVSFDMVGKQPIVLLKTAMGNRFLPIWIGHPEAAAILAKLQNTETPRPMTHDLFSTALGELDTQVVRINVVEMRDSTFFARVLLRKGDEEVELDARPSDAIALALRAKAPIYAADEVIAESAIQMEDEEAEATQSDPEQLVEDFKQFLDEVRPEEFGEDG
ncbi:MAG: bifunctional nuclease family protein [Actinobacteria bacterium]|nr:bifunctional nuclease family protein [Actinomycetota bacterium]